jgi:hypothetical protein
VHLGALRARFLLAAAVTLAAPTTGCHLVAGYDEFQFGPADAGPLLQRLSSARTERIDLLLVVDSSRSMADKQQVLERAVPDLVGELVSPPCLENDEPIANEQQPGPLEPCPEGSARAFAPVVDLHLGIITSSLGGHGSDSCSEPLENDAAHLITRTSVDGKTEPVPSYLDLGFLAWDPKGKLVPPGEQDLASFTANVGEIVVGAGEIGCGFEAPLEAWYRFLVEPDPHETVVVDEGAQQAEPQGLDTELLAERAAFLRPDSLLAIVMLSDENDCSIIDGGINYLAAQVYAPGSYNPYYLPKPRAACAVDPSSPCCRSCGQEPGPGCDETADDCAGTLAPKADPINLRCFDQKRRFGIDFLQPVERYIDVLTSDAMVADRVGNLHDNPLYTDLDPSDGIDRIRTPKSVMLAGIVGVPWQDVARLSAGPDGKPGTSDDLPDLLAGLDATGRATGGFLSGEELANSGRWAVILGDPASYVPPTDPLMRESIEPRQGNNPVTGDAVAAPDAGYLANPVNGHEYTNSSRDDLQYACIFRTLEQTDCSQESQSFCECANPNNDNPLCQAPDGEFGQIRYFAKAYPGLRQLAVLRGLGSQAIVASICARQLEDTSARDFGYRPAIGAITARLANELGDRYCVDRQLAVAPGAVACRVIEARHVTAVSGADPPTDPCPCDSWPARRSLTAGDLALVAEIKQHASVAAGALNCFCELEQTQGANLLACQGARAELPQLNAYGALASGWCYVDATTAPPIGDPSVAADCPKNKRWALRVVGFGHAADGAELFLSCGR